MDARVAALTSRFAAAGVSVPLRRVGPCTYSLGAAVLPLVLADGDSGRGGSGGGGGNVSVCVSTTAGPVELAAFLEKTRGAASVAAPGADSASP